MKGIIALLLLLLSGSVLGQCVSSPPTPNWPEQISFQPANPAPGQAVAVVLGPPTDFVALGQSVVLTGNVITVSGQLAIFGGVPPPPLPMVLQIYSYPAGVYTVRIRLTNEQVACNPIDATLVVGSVGTIGSVPASSHLALLALLLGVLTVAAWRVRARS